MAAKFKQWSLTAFVVVSFFIYSYHGRHESSRPVVAPPPPPPQPQNPAAPQPAAAKYKDGSYTGEVADAFYGNIQVQAVVSGGRLTDVQFLQYPNDRQNSVRINTAAMPILRQEAIQAQSAEVDIVSGATDSSQAFIQSLASALGQAQL